MSKRLLASLATLILLGVNGCMSPFDSAGNHSNGTETWSARRELTPYAPGVASTSFSPNGRLVATTHCPINAYEVRSSPLFVVGQLKIWDVETGINRASITIEGLTLHPVSWSSDSSYAILLVDEELIAWNVQESKLEKYEAGSANVASPDGNLIARNDGDDRVIISDVTGNRKSQLRMKGVPHRAVQFSHDNALVATLVGELREPTEIAIWNLEMEELKCSFPCRSNSRFFLQFSPDNRLFATTSIDEEFLKIFNTDDGTRRAQLAIGTSDTWGVVFAPNSNVIAVCTEGAAEKRGATVKVWNISTRQLLTEIFDKDLWGFTTVAFSPDGKTLAVGTPEGALRFFEVPMQ